MNDLKSFGNYFSVTLANGKFFQNFKVEFRFTKAEEDSEGFIIKYQKAPITEGINWNQFTNDGVAFSSQSEFEAFIYENTGFNWGVTAPTIDYINEVMNNVVQTFFIDDSDSEVIITTPGIINYYIFTGNEIVIAKLPALTEGIKKRIVFINKKSVDITINSNIGGNDIYDGEPINTKTLFAGSPYTLFNEGTNWSTSF